jgi:hypothetical protein
MVVSEEQVLAAVTRVLGGEAASLGRSAAWTSSVAARIIAELHKVDSEQAVPEPRFEDEEGKPWHPPEQQSQVMLLAEIGKLTEQRDTAREEVDELRVRLLEEAKAHDQVVEERDDAQAELGRVCTLVRGVCQELDPRDDGYSTTAAVASLPRLVDEAKAYGPMYDRRIGDLLKDQHRLQHEIDGLRNRLSDETGVPRTEPWGERDVDEHGNDLPHDVAHPRQFDEDDHDEDGAETISGYSHTVWSRHRVTIRPDGTIEIE